MLSENFKIHVVLVKIAKLTNNKLHNYSEIVHYPKLFLNFIFNSIEFVYASIYHTK